MSYLFDAQPIDAIAIALTILVIFLNGFTDAPNSIATIVATKTLSMNKACALCAICNVAGLAIVSAITKAVANRILESASFGEKRGIAIVATLASVVIFSCVSWLFSMPSSESHALVAGIWGATLALNQGASINPFLEIIFYMLMSCAISLFLSYFIFCALRRANFPYAKLQILCCATSSFMHGAQDGQKLLGVLLVVTATNRVNNTELILIVGVAMLLGTLLGGGKIVKSMGEGIAPLTPKSAFVSDISATLCLILCSAFGFPVSTSNIKACSVTGAGLGEKSAINYRTLRHIAYVAILTFPVCMLISYIIVRLTLNM